MKRVAAVFATLLVLCPTLAQAGTTGGIRGVVTDEATKLPIPNAKVFAISPSDVETTFTDARGRYCLVSLMPDVYSIAVEHTGFNPVSIPGIAIFADQVVRVDETMPRLVVTIIRDFTHPLARLVRRGVIPDVYVYNANYVGLGPPTSGQAFTLRMTPGVTFGSGAPGIR